VYGILNLLSRRGRLLGIIPEYTKSVAEVYEDFMRRYLLETSVLYILQNCHGQTGFNLPSWVPDWSKVSEQPLDLKHTFASGSLKGIHGITQLNRLRIYGVLIDTISSFQQFDYDTLKQEHVEDTVLHLLRDKELSASYICGGDILEAYIRTLCLDDLKDRYTHPPSSCLSLESASQIIVNVLAGVLYNMDEAGSSFYAQVQETLTKSHLFHTPNGYMGVTQHQAQEGDKICVIVGCKVPLLLRPTENGCYKLIGPCYVCGVMYGDALLGSLPKGISSVVGWDERGSYYFRGCLNEVDGSVSRHDPRLLALGVDDQDGRNGALVHVDSETLRKNGVDIRCFEIV
jgi:hypothetical protein